MDKVYFFVADTPDDVTKAPLTNLGCEGVFSELGNDSKRAGGATSLQTISDKNVIKSNKLYQKWENMMK